SRMMTNVLQSVMTNGTGAKVRLNNMPCAGKTGTTSGGKDGWFAGYTPYYTTVVWCGYDTPRETEDLYGSTYPGQIWKKYMEAANAGLPVKNFTPYEGQRNEDTSSSSPTNQTNNQNTDAGKTDTGSQTTNSTSTNGNAADQKGNSQNAGDNNSNTKSTQTGTGTGTSGTTNNDTSTTNSSGSSTGSGSDPNTGQTQSSGSTTTTGKN
ncbi:MAG: hypothetical protein ABRQ27_09910, partial [Clostridiaceae bacterium]